jgi:hypothetical protein
MVQVELRNMYINIDANNGSEIKVFMEHTTFMSIHSNKKQQTVPS